MTYYYEGDAPAEAIVVVPARDGDPVDLELYASASGVLLEPTGDELDCTATIVPATDDEDAYVAITLPELEVPGLQLLTLQLQTAAGRSDSFDAGAIVVQPKPATGWHTIASAHLEWSGSTTIDDVPLWQLLESSRIECAAYAPALPAGALPPANYRTAQLMHARNRNAASRVDPASGDAGTDGYALGTFPLDWTVKQVLRPLRRLGKVR